MKLDKDLYRYFYNCGTSKRYRDQETIYLEEEKSRGIYLVISGKVRVFLISLDGGEVTIELLEQGSIFGTSSMVTDSLRPVNIEAIGSTELVVCDLESFYPYFKESPELAIAFIQLISKSCDHLTNLIRKDRFYDRNQKVAAFLLENEKEGKVANFTHEQIATIVGMNRVTVSRVLKTLSDKGLVEQKHKLIIINDNASLKAIVEKRRMSQPTV